MINFNCAQVSTYKSKIKLHHDSPLKTQKSCKTWYVYRETTYHCWSHKGRCPKGIRLGSEHRLAIDLLNCMTEAEHEPDSLLQGSARGVWRRGRFGGSLFFKPF